MAILSGNNYGKVYDRRTKYGKLNKAQQKLVADNLRIAQKIATKFYRTRNVADTPYEDLYQAGLWGMCKAALKYEYGRNTKFSTYAWSSVTGAIRHYLRDKARITRLPRDVVKYRRRVLEMEKAGKTDQQIMAELGLSQENVTLCRMSWRIENKSVEASYEEGGGERLLNQIGKSNDRELKFKADFSPKVRQMVEDLSDQDIRAVLRYLDGGYKFNSAKKRKWAEAIIQKIKATAETHNK